MNRAFLIGNLASEPEQRTTQNGTAVTTFTLAVNRNFSREEADFLRIVTWRGTAENCAKFLRKGSKIAVVGEIQTRSYDATDGTKRYITEIVASDVEFLTPKQSSKDVFANEVELVADDNFPF